MLRYANDWLLTPHRLAVHEPTRTAVIADLHLGYSEARRRAGDAIPMSSVEDLWSPLQRACAELDLQGLVIAGDLCEDRVLAELIEPFLNVLRECRLELRAVVPGNHDRGWTAFRDRLPLAPEGFPLGDWTVIHGDGVWPDGPTLMGHFHPAWRESGVKQPCYLAGPNRLVLPPFSRDAAGGTGHALSRFTGYHAMVIEGEAVIDRGPLRASENPRRRPLRGFRR